LASRYFAGLWPRCRIVAVEPDRENCAMIADNCRDLIDSGRMDVVTVFAAAKPGVAAIDRSFDAYGFAKLAADGQPPEQLIACVTMDRLIDRLGPGHVDLLKCDIEGSERELFEACEPWINRIRHLVVETHSPYSLSQLYAHLERE